MRQAERRQNAFIRRESKPWICPKCGFKQPAGSKSYDVDGRFLCATCAIIMVKRK